MEKIIIFAVLTVFSMVVTGFYFIYKGTDKNRKFARAFMKLNLFVFAPVFVFGLISLVPQMASAAAAAPTSGNGLGFLAAGLITLPAEKSTAYLEFLIFSSNSLSSK